MRVTFPRLADYQRAYAVVERDDGVIFRLDSGLAGPKLPHDVRHLIVERELRIGDGIWGSIAAGTVYKSMRHLSGHQPPRAAERSVLLKKAQRERIMCAEMLSNLVEEIAVLADPSPDEIRRLTRMKLSVVPLVEPGADPADVVGCPPPAALAAAAETLQVEAARWARLRVGEEIVYDWRLANPSAVRALHRALPRPRDGGKIRRPPHRG
jgi:hypothetical protein